MGATIFLGYDQEALDREYDNRRKVPNFADHVARYASESAAARRQLPCRLDVADGPSPGETLDIFPAAGAGPAPVHVFIHGGYWQTLDKADLSYVARAFRPAGAATVAINYALIPTVDMDELVRQCRASIAWVYRRAASFGGGPARITVSGHSAGGHGHVRARPPHDRESARGPGDRAHPSHRRPVASDRTRTSQRMGRP